MIENESRLTVTMNAELEKIQGTSSSGLSGTVSLDLDQLDKSRGQFRFDLMQLQLLHAGKEGEVGPFGEMRVSRKQNDDMRTWLEISKDAPRDMLERYRYASYDIEKISDAKPTSIPRSPGKHTATLTANGVFTLHGRTSNKTVLLDVEIVVDQAGASQIKVETKQPMVVSLDDHDVRPRTAFGVLADRTLAAMGKRVAKEPHITLQLTLRRGMASQEKQL